MKRLVLVIGLAALAGCSPPARSAAEFKSHPVKDRQVVAACTQGVRLGVECAHAEIAADRLRSDQRLDHSKQNV